MLPFEDFVRPLAEGMAKVLVRFVLWVRRAVFVGDSKQQWFERYPWWALGPPWLGAAGAFYPLLNTMRGDESWAVRATASALMVLAASIVVWGGLIMLLKVASKHKSPEPPPPPAVVDPSAEMARRAERTLAEERAKYERMLSHERQRNEAMQREFEVERTAMSARLAEAVTRSERRPPATRPPKPPDQAGLASDLRVYFGALAKKAWVEYLNHNRDLDDFDRWVTAPTRVVEAYLRPKYVNAWRNSLAKHRAYEYGNPATKCFELIHAVLKYWSGAVEGQITELAILDKPDTSVSIPDTP